jgi:hypothetical protein
MRTSLKRVSAITALAIAAFGATACTPMTSPRDEPAGASTETGPTETPAQTLVEACDTVTAEWGLALDPWPSVQGPDNDTGARKDFALAQTRHEAIVTELHAVADKVAVPEVHAALEKTISAHQQYIDEVWPALMAIPEGYVADPNDPTNKISMVSKEDLRLKQEMADADMERFDLCGPVKNSQTTAQACEIVDQDWVDAATKYNQASSLIAAGDLAGGQEAGATALHQIKAAMIQVTVPEVFVSLETMYQAYQVYYEDGFLTMPTTEELAKLSLDELHAVTEKYDGLFQDWDAALTAGEADVKSLCSSAG